MTDWTAVHEKAVAAFAEGWARPHPQAWDALLAEDVELNQPMVPPTRGRQGWGREAERLLGFLPDLRGEVLSWAGREDRLFIELRLSGTLRGKPLAFRAVDELWLTADGRVTRRDSFFDSMPVAMAVAGRPGAWPAWWRSGLGPLIGRRRLRR
ncbi:nuclear transport factor 2 family protein [Amycolatopsis sp. 3B14]|uniref:nuclear transport factor 2 family protein n=1 Tax=Amycolatopsis TaxID=1813 RepID=UPI003D99EA80